MNYFVSGEGFTQRGTKDDTNNSFHNQHGLGLDLGHLGERRA